VRAWNPHGLPPSTRYVVAAAAGAAIVALAAFAAGRVRPRAAHSLESVV
jgi:hypothetical protein